MKKLLTSALLSISLAPSAFAEQTNWTGPYLGAHLSHDAAESSSAVSLGADWSGETLIKEPVTNGWSKKLKPSGSSLGVQAGYNFQTPSNFVFGGEIDYATLDLSSSSSRSFNATSSLTYSVRNEIDVDNMLSLRAKAGFAFEQTLFYVTAGWAWSTAKMGAEVLSNGGYSKEGRVSKTLDGYTVGLGIEHRVSKQLSVRMNYNFVDFGKETYATTYRPGSTFAPPAYNYQESLSQDLQAHLLNIGLNYHF